MRTQTLCPWANLSISLYFYSGFLIAVSSWLLHWPVFVLLAALPLMLVSHFQRISDSGYPLITYCDDGRFSLMMSYCRHYCLRNLSRSRYAHCYSMHCDQNQTQICSISSLSLCPRSLKAFVAFQPCFTLQALFVRPRALLLPSAPFPFRLTSP